MCVQYVNDIYAHLRESEDIRSPNADYMDAVQKDINSTMRGILVDWLVEVAEEYKLTADTLYLSVLYIDRCLSVHTVARTQLQVRSRVGAPVSRAYSVAVTTLRPPADFFLVVPFPSPPSSH
jgi:hypothetical protein